MKPFFYILVSFSCFSLLMLRVVDLSEMLRVVDLSEMAKYVKLIVQYNYLDRIQGFRESRTLKKHGYFRKILGLNKFKF